MRQTILRAAAACLFIVALAYGARAQSPPPASAAQSSQSESRTPAKPEAKVSGGLFSVEEMRGELREQREEIEELRAALREQTRLVGELRSRVEQTERLFASQQQRAATARDANYAPAAAAPKAENTSDDAAGANAPPDSKLEARVARAEGQSKKTSEAVARQLGSMTFSGDLRLRYESLYGQQNSLASSDVPGALGNPLTSRQRLRLRARFAVHGKISDEFEWGLRLATGSFPDVTSTNQTLTDFFNRKPFALDQAYFAYKPKALPGFQIQAGKFDTPWAHTEMTWDNDITVEGLSETYAREFKGSAFKNFALVAWELPVLERNSAFVLGADGHVDLSASRRAGRDLALYGAQLKTEVAPSKSLSFKLSASDLYFSGTQLITPAQVFGTNIQFPVTVTIPASGTTPARTVTTQVSIPRELLVSGNGNLGLLLASTNALNRDGRLSSGYNLVDLIARADISNSKRWPLMLLFDFVDNTQTHAVVVAGPAGADLALPNDEGRGYWAEIQAGKDVLRLPVERITRGDVMFNYTFMRIGKDAILSPFNASDIGRSTDARINRFIIGYALDPRVALTLTGFFTQSPNGVNGPFAPTPPGSLNRTLKRFQFDTILRF
ncbi:MAG TPA: putative porin [Pyrinomonadaceae bacterium]|nr:putative porin [Pyrinomonadaceae bacterium]